MAYTTTSPAYKGSSAQRYTYGGYCSPPAGERPVYSTWVAKDPCHFDKFLLLISVLCFIFIGNIIHSIMSTTREAFKPLLLPLCIIEVALIGLSSIALCRLHREKTNVPKDGHVEEESIDDLLFWKQPDIAAEYRSKVKSQNTAMKATLDSRFGVKPDVAASTASASTKRRERPPKSIPSINLNRGIDIGALYAQVLSSGTPLDRSNRRSKRYHRPAQHNPPRATVNTCNKVPSDMPRRNTDSGGLRTARATSSPDTITPLTSATKSRVESPVVTNVNVTARSTDTPMDIDASHQIPSMHTRPTSMDSHGIFDGCGYPGADGYRPTKLMDASGVFDGRGYPGADGYHPTKPMDASGVFDGYGYPGADGYRPTKPMDASGVFDGYGYPGADGYRPTKPMDASGVFDGRGYPGADGYHPTKTMDASGVFDGYGYPGADGYRPTKPMDTSGVFDGYGYPGADGYRPTEPMDASDVFDGRGYPGDDGMDWEHSQ